MRKISVPTLLVESVGDAVRARAWGAGAEWLPWVGAAVVALVFTPMRHFVASLANRVKSIREMGTNRQASSGV